MSISLILIPEPQEHSWHDSDLLWQCCMCPCRRAVGLVAWGPDKPLQCPISKPPVRVKSPWASDQANKGAFVANCCPWHYPHCCHGMPCLTSFGHTTEVVLGLYKTQTRSRRPLSSPLMPHRPSPLPHLWELIS